MSRYKIILTLAFGFLALAGQAKSAVCSGPSTGSEHSFGSIPLLDVAKARRAFAASETVKEQSELLTANGYCKIASLPDIKLVDHTCVPSMPRHCTKKYLITSQYQKDSVRFASIEAVYTISNRDVERLTVKALDPAIFGNTVQLSGADSLILLSIMNRTVQDGPVVVPGSINKSVDYANCSMVMNGRQQANCAFVDKGAQYDLTPGDANTLFELMLRYQLFNGPQAIGATGLAAKNLHCVKTLQTGAVLSCTVEDDVE